MALLISVSFLSASRPKSLLLYIYISRHTLRIIIFKLPSVLGIKPGRPFLDLTSLLARSCDLCHYISLQAALTSTHIQLNPPPSPNPPHSPLALVASVVDKHQVNRSSPKWQQVHSQQTTSTTSSCLTHCVRTVVFPNSHTEESIQAAQNTINI